MAELNVVFSSWASAGGTTLALMFAEALGLRYIYAGGVLKEWVKRMGMDPSSGDISIWEKQYGKMWDACWENYIKRKLSNDKNFLAEGKTLGFLLEEGKAFEVMVIADADIRNKRAGGDNRTEDVTVRDRLLADRWKTEFGFDLLDEDDIQNNYDFVLNNSKTGIAESFGLVSAVIQESYADPEIIQRLQDYEARLPEIEAQFWEDQKNAISGKERVKKRVEARGLYFNNEEIFADWNNQYKDLLEPLDPKMREAIEIRPTYLL